MTTSRTSATTRLFPDRLLWLLVALLVVARLMAIFGMGIMPQDAYYYFYSQHLALSYFDHPPMVAYMLRGFTSLLGSSVTAIKLTDTLVTLGSLVAFYQLARFFYDKPLALRATLFWGSTLTVAVLSLNTTPDVPLIFFWTLTLLTLAKAVFEHKLGYWLLAGLLMGLTFDSKYTAVFLYGGLILFLIMSEAHRKYLFSSALLLLTVGFVVAASPVIIWNYQNDWISFLFQSSSRAEQISKFQIKPLLFLGHLGSQLLLLLPPLGVVLGYGLFKTLLPWVRRWQFPDARLAFFIAFSVPMLAFFIPVSLFYWVKINWLMPTYIAGILLVLTPYLSTKLLHYQLAASIVFHVLIWFQLVYYPVPVRSDDTWYSWAEVSQQVQQVADKNEVQFVFSDDGYKTTAVMDYYLDIPLHAGNIMGKPALQYSLEYPDLTFLKGQSALFIDSDKKAKNTDLQVIPPQELSGYFEQVTQLAPIIVRDDGGRMVRKFWVYKCDNYLPQ